MDKFSDNLSSVPPGTVIEPTTVAALLRQLEASSGTLEFQKEAAIEDWLQYHEPSPLMVHSLKRKGLGHLLKP